MGGPIRTWIRLPPQRRPAEWRGIEDPVVEMTNALYGHPDAGGYWERHCEKGLRKIGFKSIGECYEWRSCFWNEKTKVLCIVYVDDFKLAGPKEAVEATWEDIKTKSNIGISEAEESTHFSDASITWKGLQEMEKK